MARAGAGGDEFLDRGGGVPGQQRHLLGHRIGRAGLRGQAAAATEQAHHSTVDLLQDPGNLLVGGSGQRVEHGGRSGSRAAEDAIEHDRVEMDVNVECRAESLDCRDRPALAVGNALAGRGAPQPGEDAADEHAQHRAGQRGVKGELIAQGEGQRQHPLAHGHLGDDAIDQLGGQLAHPAAPARGAEAAALAAERHDQLISAPLALDVHAAVLGPTTAQVGAQLAGDKGGKSFAAPLLGGAGKKGLEMALEGAVEGAVEDRVLWSVALIARGRAGPGHKPGPWAGAMPSPRPAGAREISSA
jgi:hypothetical protein